jgi:hypothetical protein
MSSYIDIPIETDPDVLAQEAFDFLQANIAGWVPNDANLETIMVEAYSRMTAEARDVASTVPTEIFRYFGKLAGIPAQEATFAQGSTDWTMIDSLGYTIPAGTQVGIVLSGDTTVGFETAQATVIPPGTTVANNVLIQAVEEGAASSGITGTVSLLDNLAFVSTITLDSPGTTGGVDAEDDDAYLNRLALRLQLLAPRPIIARDFSIFAQDIAGVARAVTLDGYNPNHNLLTVNQSSLETDTSGWTNQVNCAITRDLTQHSDGVACLRLRSAAAGNMEAMTSPITTYAVTPGQRITAISDFRAAGTVRQCRLNLVWYTSGSVLISVTQGTLVTDSNSAWTQVEVHGNAPATAAFVAVDAQVLATSAANEDHFIDRIALKHYDGVVWSIGGTPEFSNERMVAVACVDAAGLAVSSTIKTAVDAYLQAAREVNFIVNVIDPTYATIDVNFTAVAVVGFLPADIKAAGEQALRDYLSPANWGLPGVSGDVPFSPQWINSTTIRYLELAQVLNNVPGLDYITSLTFRMGTDAFASNDITITGPGGPVAMPLAGTMVGTVT